MCARPSRVRRSSPVFSSKAAATEVMSMKSNWLRQNSLSVRSRAGPSRSDRLTFRAIAPSRVKTSSTWAGAGIEMPALASSWIVMVSLGVSRGGGSIRTRPEPAGASGRPQP